MRTTSSGFLKHIRIAMRDDYHISLLTISHASLYPSLLICCDTVALTSRGEQYIPFPFMLDMLTDNGEPVKSTLIIQNVDRRIGYAIHKIDSPLNIKLELVMASDPEMVIMKMDHLKLRGVTVNPARVEGTLIFKNYSTLAWPGLTANKKNAPGLWRGVG